MTGMSKREGKTQRGGQRPHEAALAGCGRILNLIFRATGSL